MKENEHPPTNPVVERIIQEVRDAQQAGEIPTSAHGVYTSGTFEKPMEQEKGE